MDLRVLTFALCMFLAFDYGEGINCHVCNGMHQSQCDDPFGHYAENGDLINPDTFVSDCDDAAIKEKYGIPAGGATMCRKIYQDVRGEVRVIRGCAWEENKKKEDPKNNCYKTVMEEYNTYVCTCDSDLCNGASITHVSALLFALLPVLTMGLFR